MCNCLCQCKQRFGWSALEFELKFQYRKAPPLCDYFAYIERYEVAPGS
jgi:hypothetical protein